MKYNKWLDNKWLRKMVSSYWLIPIVLAFSFAIGFFFVWLIEV